MRSILEEETTQNIDLQHINVKLLLEGAEDLDPVIPIFHEWVQAQPFPELLIDVADYRHVHHGPGIVLIGHEADYSLDGTNGRLGLRYNRKAQFDGANQDRLIQAIRAALTAIQRLEANTRLNRNLRFKGQDIELFVNDRLLALNNDQTRQAADPEIRTLSNQLFAGAEYSLKYETDQRRLFGAFIHSERKFSVEELLENVGR